MTSRVDQILDRMVELMPATAASFKHRVLTLDPEEGEVPARSIRYGAEEPVSENLAFTDVMLEVEIDHKLQASDEDTAKRNLVEMCRETHVALMADDSLGLAYVIVTKPNGTDPPELEAETEFTVGVRTSRWLVHFRHSKADPAA